ncbi:hypothetical protein [Micromonospora mirobrigensis]|uniref:Uncharacterized protein n=1 Tax=Micromonospora mirobrigensis TaxID=262898 RepID=A0A1C5AIR4_9ACTN|nr:hypothetical protein [Micromonospora mirobrigensis]SCF44971.1 hypothetical protein GA0070564_11115 [Micromonospora mirobrigensis]
MNELAYKVLRDHAEGWFKRAQGPNLNDAERAGYLAMARGFVEWARQMRERSG